MDGCRTGQRFQGHVSRPIDLGTNTQECNDVHGSYDNS